MEVFVVGGKTYDVVITIPAGYKMPQSVLDGIARSILEEVYPLVEDVFREAIRDAIYSSSSPTKYIRRYDLLSSFSHSISGTELSVSSTAPSNVSWETGSAYGGDMTFLNILENPGRLWKGRFPRPGSDTFYQDRVDNDPRIKAAIETAVEKVVSSLNMW